MTKIYKKNSIKLLECGKCRKLFIPVNNTQRFCQKPCSMASKKRTIKEINESWVERPYTKKKRSSMVDLRFVNQTVY